MTAPIAIHEAAHAVVAAHLGLVVASVTIRPDGTGETTLAPTSPPASDDLVTLAALDRVRAENLATFWWAGVVAESLHLGRPWTAFASRATADLEAVGRVAHRQFHGAPRAADAWADAARARAVALLDAADVWAEVRAVAALLELHEHLPGAAVRQALRPTTSTAGPAHDPARPIARATPGEGVTVAP